MAFLTLSDLDLETFLELLSIGLEAAEDISHLANALLVFSLDDLLIPHLCPSHIVPQLHPGTLGWDMK